MSPQLNSRPNSATVIFGHQEVFDRFDNYINVLNSDTATLQDMEAAFDSVFHEDVVANIEGSGSVLRKEDLKPMVFQNFEDEATMAFEKMETIDEMHVEVIFSKEGVFRRHQVVTIKDGKVVRLQPFNEADDLLNRLEVYINVQNGEGSTLQDMEAVFEKIFHDDLVANIEGAGSSLRKRDAWKMVFKDFLENAELSFEKMEVLDNSHVEIVIIKEGKDGWRRHQILRVKDAKIVGIETIKDVHTLLHNLSEYIKVQNDDGSTVQDMQATFDNLFHDDLVANIDGAGSGLGKEDAREMVLQDFVERARLAFEKVKVIDDSHVEIVLAKEGEWTRHQILTVENGKIAKIETAKDEKGDAKLVRFDSGPLVAAH